MQIITAAPMPTDTPITTVRISFSFRSVICINKKICKYYNFLSDNATAAHVNKLEAAMLTLHASKRRNIAHVTIQ